jgi:methyl-accepting chemotaxis protein
MVSLANAVEELAQGKLDAKVKAVTEPIHLDWKDEFGTLCATIDGMIGKMHGIMDSYGRAQVSMKGVIHNATSTVCDAVGKLDKGALVPLCDGIEALSHGDLTKHLDVKVSKMAVEEGSEFAVLAVSVNSASERVEQAIANYNATRDSLSGLVTETRGSANNIVSGCDELARSSEDLSSRTTEQASSLEETASSMEQMTSTVRRNADNAKHANELSAHAREVAHNGGGIVNNAVNAMSEINTASKRINDIIVVIDEIAFQTNLLALNAAVEAARVGEQGKGFAVVAAEVRSLAGRSSTAAKEIKSLVQDSVQKVEDGSALVNESGAQLKEIVTAINKVAEIVAEISAASQEQSVGIEQVNKAVNQMDEITQQNAALVEETAASCQSMAQQSQTLQSLVNQFKTDTQNEATPAAHQQQAHHAAVRTGTGGSRQASWGASSRKPKLTLHTEADEMDM